MARVRQRVAKSSETPEARKVNRLSNIVVEEVSIVDKPANQRVFLVVKSEKGDGGTTPPPPEPPDAATRPTGMAPLKISATEKAKYTTALAAIAAKVSEVAKALEGAEVVEGVATPEAVTKAFADIGALLGVEVGKAGRKISAPRLEAMRQAHTLLGQVIAEADPPELEAPAEPAAKSAVAPVAPPAAPPPAAPVADPAVTAAIKEMTETMGVLVKAVGVQKKRIDELSSSDGGSRQVPVDKSETAADGEEDLSWPLDMNRPFKRESTPVEKSFFTQQ